MENVYQVLKYYTVGGNGVLLNWKEITNRMPYFYRYNYKLHSHLAADLCLYFLIG